MSAPVSPDKLAAASATPAAGVVMDAIPDYGTNAALQATRQASSMAAAAYADAMKRKARIVRCSRWALAIAYLIIAGVAGIVLWQVIVNHEERHVAAWSVAAIFSAIAVPLSLHDMHLHFMHYTRPELQKHYIRILWMVPIYAIESWLALRFKEQKFYLEAGREAYEAWVIYSFFSLLRTFLGTPAALTASLRASRGANSRVKFIPPVCCLRGWRLDNGEFQLRTSTGVLQYVVVRLVCTIIGFVCELTDVYAEGQWKAYDQAYLWLTIAINVSQAWAMFSLVMFYKTLKVELKPLKPLGKFLVVKAVVFFSFWQGIFIAGAASTGVLKPTLDYSKEDISKGLQDFLICIEMAFAAIAHHFFFSYKDFDPSNAEMEATRARTEEANRALMHQGAVDKASPLLTAGGASSGDGSTPRHHPTHVPYHGAWAAFKDMIFPKDVFTDVKHQMALAKGIKKEAASSAVETMSPAAPAASIVSETGAVAVAVPPVAMVETLPSLPRESSSVMTGGSLPKL